MYVLSDISDVRMIFLQHSLTYSFLPDSYIYLEMANFPLVPFRLEVLRQYKEANTTISSIAVLPHLCSFYTVWDLSTQMLDQSAKLII